MTNAIGIQFSPDGTWVAFTAYSTFGVYSLEAHHLVYKSTFGTAGLTGSAFSPDGRHLVVVSADGGGAVYRATGAEQSVIDAGPIDSEIVELPLALTREGVVATFSPTEGGNAHRPVVRTWSWNGESTAPPLVLAPNNCPYFGVAPVGTVDFVATADCGQLGDKATSPQPVTVWDVGKRKVVKTLTTTAAGVGDFPEISRDGSWILEHVQQKANPRQPVLNVLNVKTGVTTLINEHCVGALRGPAITDDGARVMVPCGSELLGWQMTTKPPAAYRLAAGFVTQPQGRLSFSPDGRRVGVANMNGEGQVGILDAETGKTLAVLAGHTDRVPRVVWSPNGKLFLTASRDGTARVWDPTSGRLLRTLDHPAPLFGAAFSPDSRTIATMDANGTIRVWDACTDCENPDALLALAKTRVTRELTPSERVTYLR